MLESGAVIVGIESMGVFVPTVIYRLKSVQIAAIILAHLRFAFVEYLTVERNLTLNLFERSILPLLLSHGCKVVFHGDLLCATNFKKFRFLEILSIRSNEIESTSGI